MTALVALLAAACSSGTDDEPGEPPVDETPVVEALPTTLRTGEVAGALGGKRTDAAVAAVGEVVDGWIDAAWAGGEWPREISGAYADFTARARDKAAKDSAVTSAARFSERVESVEVTKRVVRVDMAAPKGNVAGATARVVLDLATSGDVERKVQVRGRLFLAPAGGGWKIFGYDLTLGGQ